MRSFISSAALALAASSLVSAAPASHGRPSNNGGIIQLPLGDGFPTPSAEQLKEIEALAFGTLSNLPPPPKLSPDTLTSLRLVAFNENFESFFFANFLKELDNPHFMRTLGDLKVSKDVLTKTIKSILAVEELHAVNANNALVKVGKVNPIQPCKYKFPVDDVKSAVVLANRFTDVVMGTLQDVIVDAATAGDAGFTRGVAAAAEDEGEQNGGFRLFLGQTRPQSQPFHTSGVRDFAFSILQDFIEPNSCPNSDEIDLTVFQPLSASDPHAKNQDIEFSFSLSDERSATANQEKPKVRPNELISASSFKATYGKGTSFKDLSITYLSGQNIISEPVKSIHFDGADVKVKAFFPQQDNDIFGLALAVLTKGTGPFNSTQQVLDATLRGPAPLEVIEMNN